MFFGEFNIIILFFVAWKTTILMIHRHGEGQCSTAYFCWPHKDWLAPRGLAPRHSYANSRTRNKIQHNEIISMGGKRKLYASRWKSLFLCRISSNWPCLIIEHQVSYQQDDYSLNCTSSSRAVCVEIRLRVLRFFLCPERTEGEISWAGGFSTHRIAIIGKFENYKDNNIWSHHQVK